MSALEELISVNKIATIQLGLITVPVEQGTF